MNHSTLRQLKAKLFGSVQYSSEGKNHLPNIPIIMKMRTKFLFTLALLLAGGSSISFAQVTGNPATDAGWGASLGLSSAAPLLLYETGNFSVNVYSTAFNLTAGSPLLGTLGTMDGWSVGDTIVGIGGVFAATGNSSVTYDNANNTVTTRFV